VDSKRLESLKSFFSDYFALVGPTEAPAQYHRWCVLSAVGAMLGRQAHLPFGHWMIYPNMYVMLMGDPGARKNSAISVAKDLLERSVGYDKFAADKISKENFLARMVDTPEDEEELMELSMEGMVSQRYIVAEEFTDFIGKNNAEFCTTLAKLWDCPPKYEHPKLHGKDVFVPFPTVSILSGNTPQAYSLNMPVEAMGQGFMSRLLHIHGEATGIKITIPPPPNRDFMTRMDLRFKQIFRETRGAFKIPEEVEKVWLDRIYKEYKGIEDYRFKHYNGRRFTHLIKLSMILAACRLSNSIEKEDVIVANTILHYTEARMPTALGEFGKARNADVANAVIGIMKAAKMPVTIRYLWKQVAQDLNRQDELQEIVRNLQVAGKIKLVTGANNLQGYVTNFEAQPGWKDDLLCKDFLTEGEKV
jgi:hypothetical protein